MKRQHKILAGIATLAVAGLIAFNAHAPAHIGPANLYPDPALTPGLVATTDFNELTATSACGTYSQCHRKTTSAMKTAVCKEYPDNCKTKVEIDHFCPLALGCADSLANLWAEPEVNQWNGADFGFHTKDKLETFLVNQMKAGKITPADAQNCILADWVACYQKYFSAGALGGVVTDEEDSITN